jgi:hypothetical protein
MSQVSPGWYPDPSGRFVQRYHDGNRWTEHVADAQGNRDTDAPVGQAGSASQAGQQYGPGGQRSSDPYGQRSAGAERDYGAQSAWRQGYGQDSSGERDYGAQSAWRQGYGQDSSGERDYGAQSAREQGYGQGAPGSDRGFEQRVAREQGWGQERAVSERGDRRERDETGWDQGAGGWQAQGGRAASRSQWPQAQGATRSGGDSWAPTPTGGQAAGAGWPVAGQGRGPGRYDTGQRYGQPAGYGEPATSRQAGYGYAPPVSSRAFTPTIGLIVSAVGAVLLLLSLFGLDFLELSLADFSQSVSLGDIAGEFGDGAPAALSTYADFGRFLAILLIVFAVLATAKVAPQLRDVSALPVIVAVACGGFALWHVLAMLAGADEGVDVSPTFGAILGILGYVGLAAGPFLRRPLQSQREDASTALCR